MELRRGEVEWSHIYSILSRNIGGWSIWIGGGGGGGGERRANS